MNTKDNSTIESLLGALQCFFPTKMTASLLLSTSMFAI